MHKYAIMNTTGKRIKFFRESLKLTQKSLAEFLFISQSNYSRIENDEIKINFGIIEKLTLIFNINEELLTNLEGPINIHNSLERYSKNTVEYKYIISEELKTLYEDKIRLLEEKVAYLEMNK